MNVTFLHCIIDKRCLNKYWKTSLPVSIPSHPMPHSRSNPSYQFAVHVQSLRSISLQSIGQKYVSKTKCGRIRCSGETEEEKNFTRGKCWVISLSCAMGSQEMQSSWNVISFTPGVLNWAGLLPRGHCPFLETFWLLQLAELVMGTVLLASYM